MTNPQLEQYPGYFPEGSRPFWSRLKVGLVAGVLGLVIGIGGGGDDTSVPAAATEPSDDVQAQLSKAQDDNAELEKQLKDSRAKEETAVRSAVKQTKRASGAAQRTAVRTAVAEARTEERRKTAAAVRTARASAVAAAVPATTAPAPLASPAASTDPHFSWCYEANDAGYGPYYQGQDPEYDWYDDADGDGVVCES